MKIHLCPDQIEQLDNLIADTILPALQEDVCFPNMEDMDLDNPIYDEVYCERQDVLLREAMRYLSANLT